MQSNLSRREEAAAAPALLTVREAAALLKVGEAKLRRIIHGGFLRAYRVGAELRIAESDLRSFVETNVATRQQRKGRKATLQGAEKDCVGPPWEEGSARGTP